MKIQQYVVQKYVNAESVAEAILKSKRLPIHEVYIHGGWFEKVGNHEFNRTPVVPVQGFKKK